MTEVLRDKNGKIRLCSRCGELATTRVKSEWLGPNCLQQRRIKQAQTAAQPNCLCGNKVRLNSLMCGSCEDVHDEEQEQLSEQHMMFDRIQNSDTLEELRAIVLALAIKIYN